MAAKLTRKVTSSKFDHIAIVLKYDEEPGELFILDSTTQGVTVSRWSDFRLITQDYYHHLFYRKLHTDRNEDFFLKLDTFIKHVVGCKYHFSVTDVLFKRTMFTDKRGPGENTGAAAEREYFCSELIAIAYKECGLIRTDKASC